MVDRIGIDFMQHSREHMQTLNGVVFPIGWSSIDLPLARSTILCSLVNNLLLTHKHDGTTIGHTHQARGWARWWSKLFVFAGYKIL